ncbi:hypothetical protein RHGRI_011485 [Rhododendron griersonianum]|uniref:Uncharacterized protein n=1 Tax=Rhododendron griersonianum TaxID=479676 RepID=A0AAV6KMB1_9ERIC|nr:hypothetical protein RHGRI_011485 [Rhododendron griersonianum]
MVQCIHGPMDQGQANELHKEQYQPSPSEVMVIQPSSKRKMDARHTWEITFTEQDMEGVSFPHNDALVLSIPFQRKMVCRVLIDQGSLVEILYYSAFKALGLTKNQLTPVDAPLVGFIRILVYPVGKIKLPVYAGSVQLDVEFIGRQESIRGNQMASIKCFVNSVRGNGKAKEIQCIEFSGLDRAT